jgi:hypothetical protein
MVLEKDGEIISVDLMRIHGIKVVEMRFIGTLLAYQKQESDSSLGYWYRVGVSISQVEKLRN